MSEFNVLVVDAEEKFLDTTVKILRKKGLTTEGAEGGGKTLGIIGRNRTCTGG